MTVNRMPPRIGPQARDGSERRDVDGVVDVDVERLPLGGHAIEQTTQLVEPADVGPHRERAPAQRVQPIDDVLRVAVARDVVDGHISAKLAELERDRPTDAA